MRYKLRHGSTVAILALASLGAQVGYAQAIDPHQPANNGSLAASATVAPGAVAPGLDPGTARLNAAAATAADSEHQKQANVDQAYKTDLASYDASVAEHAKALKANDAQYAAKAAAYASAMAAWREQVAACKAGRQSSCRAPAPQPSSY